MAVSSSSAYVHSGLRAVTVQYLSVDMLDVVEAGRQRGNCGRYCCVSCCVPVGVRSQTWGKTMRRSASALVGAMSYACCTRICHTDQQIG